MADVGDLRSLLAQADAGEWVGDLPRLPGVRLRVRSTSSGAMTRALGRAYRACPKELRDEEGRITDEAERDIDLDILASHGVVDWDITMDGEPYPCTRENVREMLSFADFENGVRIAAARVQNAEEERAQAMAGNSPAPSKRKTKGAPST